MQSQDNVLQLCKSISSSLGDTSEDYKNNIRILLDVCNGPPRNRTGVSFTNVLNHEEVLLSLIRIKEIADYLKKHSGFLVTVVRTLLKFYKVPWDPIFSLTYDILQSPCPSTEELKILLWEKRDLPAKYGLLFFKTDPEYFENDIVNMYLAYSDLKTDIWKEQKSIKFIVWSSQSSEVFVIMTAILNQILIHAQYKNTVLKVVEDFIRNVMTECNNAKKDFVLLYPLEYQSLVSFLILEPEINPCKENLIKHLHGIELTNPMLALLLYSHFPQWSDP